MSGRWQVTSRGAQRRAERERATGLDREDEAARWLEDHDPTTPPPQSKSLLKSKGLHRWRQERS